MSEVLDIDADLKRAEEQRTRMRKRVDYGNAHESHLAYADGLVAGLESAKATIGVNDRTFAERLKNEAMTGDSEDDHGTADDLLCALLESLGCKESVAAFKAVRKWYA